MLAAGGDSGAFVRDTGTGGRLFRWEHTKRRILASNTKLFTVGAALARKGVDGTFRTRILVGNPAHAKAGTVDGSLFLVGGGDPTFGSSAYTRATYGGGATVESLARKLHDRGLRVVKGGVVGDESLFDSLRSGPAEGYRASGEVGGPLSALAYNHGLMSNGHFQVDPPSYAAARLTDALRSLGVQIHSSPRSGHTPGSAKELARVDSLPMRRIAELTAMPSDNYFAELLAKGIGGGTTAGGASAEVDFAASRGAKVHLADGSGLSRSDQAAPQEVVHYLYDERSAPEFDALFSALPVAGESGTLATRMTTGAAHRNCSAKTGTLSDVSTLSGYCRSRSGRTLVFSILMNHMGSISAAHKYQDKMAQSMANYGG
jgi:D-alanyl-D-alanine carboxypeptidase/D-alanyl-D-alanine-endopeptidase (penicillin-binding protein 4)